jgi:hypothetical protein
MNGNEDKGETKPMNITNKRTEEKAQSIIEYILLLAIVIAVLLVFFMANGPFSTAHQHVIQTQGDIMLNAARQIF